MAFRKSIFLTGFPGFIAERLVAKLAAADTQFFLLVEERMTSTAVRSVERIAADKSIPLENFALVSGDITKPNLGVADEDLDQISAETTDVFHLAAVYDLAVAKNIARTVNFEGTKNVNDLARSLPNLKRYNYVSTCYVAGRRTGRILESELEHPEGFRNFYEETKYLAELEVEKLKEEIPLTIFRPSVVVGDSGTGETTKYDGIYYLIRYLRRAPAMLRLVNVGNKNVRLNLVPVDFVVDGIATLCEDDAAVGKTVALADPEPLTTSELFDEISAKLSGKRSVIQPPPALIQNSLLLPLGPPLTGLPHSAVPYFFLVQEYDTSVADALLGPHGVKCPNFRDYVGQLLTYVAKHPQL